MSSARTIWLCPDQIFDGQKLRTDVALSVEDGRTGKIAPLSDLPGDAHQVQLRGTLSPGFLDLQVNGGGGTLFNADPTPKGLKRMIAAHHGLGTVGILATVITDAPEILERAVGAVLAAKDTSGLLGIHIEGPHISLERRGTHAPEHVRPMGPDTIALVAQMRNAGLPVMITVAPEAVTHAQVSSLSEMGAVVSLGHTNADAETCDAALSAGASCFTHLFNAMSPMANRAPGATGAAIASTAHAGFICDGIHVSDTMLEIAIRARPEPDRMFLVSDAMATVGGPDRFELYGMEIRLCDGRLVNAEGSLAGAHTTMAEGVARLVNVLNVSAEQAFRMAVTIPSGVMDLGLDRIDGRDLEDIILLDERLAFADRQPLAYLPGTVAG